MKKPFEKGTLAIAKNKSANSKLGDAATTYAAQTSCPTSCVFFDGGGCYAESGAIGKFVTAPLNTAARAIEHTDLDVALAECEAIDRLDPVRGRPLRLHTVGDCRTDAAARIVAGAARRYRVRGGGPVWTYTHAWRDVKRESWGDVSVLASCETPMDVLLAEMRGYATALVVDEFEGDKAYWVWDPPDHPSVPVKLIPCPSQTRDVHCSDCGLCFDDSRLRTEGLSIGFAVHGSALAVKKAKAALSDPDDPERKMTSRDHALRFREEHGRWPLARELARRAGVTYGSAYEMLAVLR